MLGQTVSLLQDFKDQGITPKLWFRDDDICTDSPNFRLLMQSAKHGFPMLFGAVPYRLKFSDAELKYINALPENVFFCVHGFNHINRAEQAPLSEFPAELNAEQGHREISYGVEKVSSTFGNKYLSIFIPPWNYIAPNHISSLQQSGIKCVSGSTDLQLDFGESNLKSLPINLDILNYGEDIWFNLKSNEELDALLYGLLTQWHANENFEQPIGLLSHHTSMLSKDIARLNNIIKTIAPYFSPADLNLA